MTPVRVRAAAAAAPLITFTLMSSSREMAKCVSGQVRLDRPGRAGASSVFIFVFGGAGGHTSLRMARIFLRAGVLQCARSAGGAVYEAQELWITLFRIHAGHQHVRKYRGMGP